MNAGDDRRWLAAAAALAERARVRSAPNPAVGCVIVRDGVVVGRGWTQPGGRPHAEAQAIELAAARAKGATLYTTLEPCAHASPRGPTCADLIPAAGIVRVVIGVRDPDPRTDGRGAARLSDAGVDVVLLDDSASRRSLAGFLTRQQLGRPHVTLKLALSLDGGVAMADGRSQWITGEAARAHAHVERSRHDAILVGRGTFDADRPRLDVRLPGLASRSPARIVLTRHPLPDDAAGWTAIDAVERIDALPGNHLMVEGGAVTAAAFLAAGRVDRLLIYRAPIVIGGARSLPDIGLTDLNAAHGCWQAHDTRMLGSDRVEVYERVRN
ncbi:MULTISPECIES: bifunctional diaminohydroxyphosphoribosylaminopyrimidine deaminase/5-amino-6-(5-phosphoribosylamino)uracil reductase RibD [unclassified Sphingomonas]|uniref:bifunctional diaminohydroxyphosphoribosylaminopyrimidine deaminase/5-amino-6-(5-phosphoribosylamino)uracil reductase RibD n=1 Tax=Sphingomonas sp. CCH19-C6 TaxID=1768783 RepID=UPI0022B24797|nr:MULTISPECIES: bifunctional diaminohydroxyphosphoribosylaminopyrimidine deaminase/5-amino-6-(5-phosphoribosylamino)uracil reductase RibD [unclassified Sphingomonas]